jgi:hypothetical protein
MLRLCYFCLRCLSGVIYKYTRTKDFGSASRSGTGQTKTIVWEECGGIYILGGCKVGLSWPWGQDGPLCISTINTLAT